MKISQQPVLRDTLSVVIPVFNEELNLGRCLESVKWADEIIVVDMFSNDKTIEIAKEFKCKIVLRQPKNGVFDENRLFGMKMAKSEWILKIDADEELTPELQTEIQNILVQQPNDIDGYFLKNKIYFFGKEVKHGPVKKNGNEFRLFRSKKWSYNPDHFHQQITVKGKTKLSNSFYKHYNYNSIQQFFEKTNKYTSVDSKYFYETGKRVTLVILIFAPLKTFIKLFFFQFGFLDGELGLISCLLYSIYNLILKLKQYELQKFNNLN